LELNRAADPAAKVVSLVEAAALVAAIEMFIEQLGLATLSFYVHASTLHKLSHL
jgi:hypothetical protein